VNGSKSMNVILLGAPGSGKGTEAKRLSALTGMKHISTGDIFRAEIAAKTPLGLEAESYISKGNLVPDSVTLNMVKTRLASEKSGLLFDGFPRSLAQAEGLDAWFRETGRKVDAVVFLDVPDEKIIDRLVYRRTCASCGKIYNLKTLPPRKEGVCDSCGGELRQRADDREDVIRQRLEAYRRLTQPLVEYYRKAGVFYSVDGSGTPEQVEAAVAALPGIEKAR